MEGILASILDRFWWILEPKLGPKIDQKSIQKGIEKMMKKRSALEADSRTAWRNARSPGGGHWRGLEALELEGICIKKSGTPSQGWPADSNRCAHSAGPR